MATRQSKGAGIKPMIAKILSILYDIGDSYIVIKLIQGFMIQGMATGFPAVVQLQFSDLCPIHQAWQTHSIGIYKVRSPIAKFTHDKESTLIDRKVLVIEGKHDDGSFAFCCAKELTARKQQRNPQ